MVCKICIAGKQGLYNNYMISIQNYINGHDPRQFEENRHVSVVFYTCPFKYNYQLLMKCTHFAYIL